MHQQELARQTRVLHTPRIQRLPGAASRIHGEVAESDRHRLAVPADRREHVLRPLGVVLADVVADLKRVRVVRELLGLPECSGWTGDLDQADVEFNLPMDPKPTWSGRPCTWSTMVSSREPCS